MDCICFAFRFFIFQTKDTSDDKVTEDIRAIQQLGLPMVENVTDADLPSMSRAYLAMKQLISDNNFDAIAIRLVLSI